MKKYVLDGEVYYLKDGIFYDSQFIEVDNRTAEKLRKLWTWGDSEQKPEIKTTKQKSIGVEKQNNYVNKTTQKNLGQYDYIKVPKEDTMPQKVINVVHKAPQLKDYGLTQDDIEEYKNQKIQLEKAQQKIDELNRQLFVEQDEAEGKCQTIAWVTVIIGFFLAIVIGCLNMDTISDFGGLLLFAACTILLPFVVYKVAKSQSAVLQKSPRSINRYNYIDKNLERKIAEFEMATHNFKIEEERRTIEFWDNLTGHQFEREVANLLDPLCYKVYTTPGSGDGGIDNIMIYNGKKYAIQCKHHIKPCGPGALRELRGIISDSDDYYQGIFISLNGYTPGAIEENNNSKNPIILWDRGKLIQIAKVKDLSVFL